MSNSVWVCQAGTVEDSGTVTQLHGSKQVENGIEQFQSAWEGSPAQKEAVKEEIQGLKSFQETCFKKVKANADKVVLKGRGGIRGNAMDDYVIILQSLQLRTYGTK